MKPIKNIDKLDKRQKKYLKDKFDISAWKDLTPTILKNLKEAMKELTDTRQQVKIKYKIWDVLTCVVISCLCGMKTWEEMHDFVVMKYEFFRQFLKMTGGIPSAKTYERIMSIIDKEELKVIVQDFFKTITTNLYSKMDILNIDGRVNNGSKRKATIKVDAVSPLNCLNVYSNNMRMCIAEETIDKKTNEIPTTATILEKLNVKDCIITWDALNTQKDNISAVSKAKAYYVVPIKGNHALFYQDLIDYFDDDEQNLIIGGKINTAYKKENEYKNGCSITYEYFQTTNIKWYEDYKNWQGLKTIGMVKKTIVSQNNGKEEKSIESRYYIANIDLNIELFKDAIRKHWSVENKLHWHLDVTFNMDNNHTLDKNALMNLEIINKFCLGMLERVKPYYNMSLKRIMNILSLDVENSFLEFLAFLALANNND
jgi:transposase DDE domain